MLQDRALCYWPQKTAGRDVDQAVDDCRLMLRGAADRQVTVKQSRRAHEMRLLGLAAGSMEPSTLVSAESPQAEFATDRQVSRSNLVARKDDACELDTERPGGGPRGFEIGAKGLDVASLFQAIEMRNGVRPDLLAREIQDSPDQRQPVVVRVALLVYPDLDEVMVGGHSRIAVTRLARGKRGEQRLVGRKKQQTHRRPRAGDVALGEKLEQRGNDLADPENVGAVIRNCALVTNAPQQLEIQRNDQRAILHCASPRRREATLGRHRTHEQAWPVRVLSSPARLRVLIRKRSCVSQHAARGESRHDPSRLEARLRLWHQSPIWHGA